MQMTVQDEQEAVVRMVFQRLRRSWTRMVPCSARAEVDVATNGTDPVGLRVPDQLPGRHSIALVPVLVRSGAVLSPSRPVSTGPDVANTVVTGGSP